MGLFDTVKTTKEMYCPFCSTPLPSDWQTKSGESRMEHYTREEFESKYFKLTWWRGCVKCSKCKEFIDLEFTNKSKENREYHAACAESTRDSMRASQSKEHPNHGYRMQDSPQHISNAWCIPCRNMDVPNGSLPPDALPQLLEHEKAVKEEWERTKPERNKRFWELMSELQQEEQDDK